MHLTEECIRGTRPNLLQGKRHGHGKCCGYDWQTQTPTKSSAEPKRQPPRLGNATNWGLLLQGWINRRSSQPRYNLKSPYPVSSMLPTRFKLHCSRTATIQECPTIHLLTNLCRSPASPGGAATPAIPTAKLPNWLSPTAMVFRLESILTPQAKLREPGLNRRYPPALYAPKDVSRVSWANSCLAPPANSSVFKYLHN